MVDEVLSGNLNFYDFPFPSKAIFRNNPDAWLADDTRTPLGVSVSLARKFQMIADSACRDRERLEEILSSRSWRLVSKFRNFALDHPRLVRFLQKIQDWVWKR